MRHALSSSLLLLALATMAGCTTSPSTAFPDAAALVASPDRTAADRTNDLRRKPVETLAFIGVRPGSTALDVSAGGGYTTELLARAIGPGGRVYAQVPPRTATGPRPAAPEGGAAAPPVPAAPRPPGAAILDRAERLGRTAAPIELVVQPFDDPVPAAVADARLDLVTLMFNYHDLGFLGVDRDRMNQRIFRALRSGGVYVIADHAGRDGTGISESGTLHRVEEAFVRREVEGAGFRWVASGDFLRNAADPRDRNTPEPPGPKDEFVLKFVKP